MSWKQKVFAVVLFGLAWLFIFVANVEAGPTILGWYGYKTPVATWIPKMMGCSDGSTWNANGGSNGCSTYCRVGGSCLTFCPEFTCGTYAEVDSCGKYTACVSACPNGDLLANGVCAPKCPTGQVRNQTTFVCAPPPCPTGVTTSYSFTGDVLPATGCIGGCSMSTGGISVGIRVDGVMKWLTHGTSTGETCTGGDTLSTNLPIEPTLDNCVTNSKGQTVCPGETSDCVTVDGQQVCGPSGIDGKDCEMVNGKVVCADATLGDAPENCIISADGKMRCVGDTVKVESGTTRVTDPVTGNTTQTTTTTSGMKGSGTKTTTTVIGPDGKVISSSTSLTGGTDPGQSGAGGGSLDGSGDGEIEGTDEETTDEEEIASQTGMPEREERDAVAWGRTAEEAQASLKAAWDAVPVVAAVQGFANYSPASFSGGCPDFCVPIFGEMLCTEVHCDLWQAVGGALGAVMMVLYGFAGIRIILSA